MSASRIRQVYTGALAAKDRQPPGKCLVNAETGQVSGYPTYQELTHSPQMSVDRFV
jgi:hypothetical protein